MSSTAEAEITNPSCKVTSVDEARAKRSDLLSQTAKQPRPQDQESRKRGREESGKPLALPGTTTSLPAGTNAPKSNLLSRLTDSRKPNLSDTANSIGNGKKVSALKRKSIDDVKLSDDIPDDVGGDASDVPLVEAIPMFGAGYRAGIDSEQQDAQRPDYAALMRARFGDDDE